MWFARRLAIGIGSLMGLAVLVVGFPVGIVVAFGSPVPSTMPSASGVWTTLTQSGLTNDDIRMVAGWACWLLWSVPAWTVLAEVVALLRQRNARRVRVAGPLQPLVAQLVAWCALTFTPAPPRHAGNVPANRQALVAVLSREELAPMQTPLPTASVAEPVEVVRPGDTLWAIAGRRLGNPFRWVAIWHKDRGMLEPDGRHWDNPDRIYVGWTVPLPAEADRTTTPPGGVAASNGAPHVATERPEPAKPPIDRPPFPTTERPSPPAPHHHHANGECPPAVTLPSGGVVPLVLASALAAAVTLARLQRRRKYRPSEPRPRTGPLPPEPFMTATVARLLRHLSTVRRAATEDSEGEPTGAAWVIPGADRRPGEVVLGHRGNEPVVVDLLARPGLALGGEGAVAVARAIALQVIAEGQRGRAEVIAVGPAAAGTLSGAEDVPNASVEPSPENGLTHVEIELMGRRRMMEESGVADFREFVATQPYEPMPLLLVIASADVEHERLAAVLKSGARLGIAGIALCDDAAAWPGGAMTVGARGELQAADGTIGPDLAGARLVSLSDDEARDCLSVIAMSTGSRPIPEPAVVADAPLVPLARPEPAATTSSPEEDATVARVGRLEAEEPRATPAPVRASLFGAYRIDVCGEEVRTGLRRSARELLAYLVLHSGGTRPEAAIADIWPDLDEQRGAEQFRTAIRNLRHVFRGLTGSRLPMFIEHRAERFAIDTELIGADVLDVEAALRTCDRAEDDAAREAALGQILDSYAGELLDGYQRPWLEPFREELRQRVLQAALRLAELRATLSEEAALPILERATRINPYAEEVYRILMAAQARAGHSDMVGTTLRTLERRLAELDAEPEDATVQLAARLSRAENFA